MSDTIYRPISDADDESETHATTELPVASWSKFKDELEAGVDRAALTVDQAVEETVRKRQETPTAENAFERPIVRLRSKGGPQTLREATEDLSYSRGFQKRAELLEAGYTEDEIQQLGIEQLKAAERGDDLRNPPPDVVEIPREFGETGNEPLDAHEAANKITEWRQQEAQRREAELAELTGEHAARQQEYEQAQQPAQQQQQPQRPDPVQLERQQLALERQRISALKSMEGTEANLRNSYARLVKTVLDDFPGLKTSVPTQADIEELRQKAPARFNQLAAADRALREHQIGIAHLAQQRQHHEQQQAQVNARARSAARAQQDAQFEERAARSIPNWETVQGEVRTQARKTLESAGLSQAEIDHLWTGDHTIDAHSSALQLLLAKAAQWDLAQQKARQVRQTPMPRVIRPGAGVDRTSAGMDHVADLRARLRTSKGSDGIKLGTQLLKATRALNNRG
jgi:ribosomal protein L13E